MHKKSAFTLIETLLAITIISCMMMAGFQVVSNMSLSRVQIAQKLDVNTELYSAVENIVRIVEEGGNVDYEEYWNRKMLGTGAISAGHYTNFSGWGNYGGGGILGSNAFGADPYICLSGNASPMGKEGCSTAHNSAGASVVGQTQRYSQYALQFSDYNADGDGDGGDFDVNGSPVGDNDDEIYFGSGPSAFDSSTSQKELYLIQKAPLGKPNPERLMLRVNRIPDPDAPTGKVCNPDGTGEGCRGNIQMLKLVGYDWGMAHTGSVASTGRYDWTIDTWLCQGDFNCDGVDNIAYTNTGWVDLFSDDIDVQSIEFFPYPFKTPKYSWNESDTNIFVHPYVRLKITLWPSWKKKRSLKNTGGFTTVTTLVNLNP